MSDDGWEARMSARAQARGAAGVRLPDGRPLSDAPYGRRHEGHTQHWCGSAEMCSCGAILGTTCIAIPEDYVPEPCPVCGE